MRIHSAPRRTCLQLRCAAHAASPPHQALDYFQLHERKIGRITDTGRLSSSVAAAVAGHPQCQTLTAFSSRLELSANPRMPLVAQVIMFAITSSGRSAKASVEAIRYPSTHRRACNQPDVFLCMCTCTSSSPRPVDHDKIGTCRTSQIVVR